MTESYPQENKIDELSFRSYAMFVQSKLMSSILDLDKLVEIAIDAFVELMRLDFGFIMLFDEKSQQLSVEAIKGMKSHTIKKTKINVDKDIIQRLTKKNAAIFLSEPEKPLPIKVLFQKMLEKVGGDIVLSIPLVSKKNLLGLVNLGRREFEAPFKQADLEFLYTLADQVAIAIENAILYQNKIEVEKLRVIEHKHAEEKIKEYSENLELMVEERTKDLNKALSDSAEARDRVDGILKSVADGLIVTDIYNRVILMNRAAEDLLGVHLSEVIDRPIDLAIDDKTLRERVKETLDKKTTGYEFDFELPGDDQKFSRIMRARTSGIKDKKGNQTGIITIIHDVSREREVDRMKTEFISTAAHELRTPLTSIQGFSEILLVRENLKEEEKKRFLTHINRQAVNLAAIISDLLDISRIESGRSFVLEKKHHVMGNIISDVVGLFKGQTEKHQFKVMLPKKKIELKIDSDKIAQVMKNLISNAVKYSPEGGEILIKGESTKNIYAVSVKDEGLGMTPEQIDKIFDKFYRVDSSNSAIEGTGLGMSITKLIVEAHGGNISVESEYGKGTTVTFSLPLS